MITKYRFRRRNTIIHTAPPRCDRVFDEDMDTWRVVIDRPGR